MRLAASSLLLIACASACTLQADPPAPYTATPLGNGLRIHDIQNPASPHYSPNKSVNVTSIVVNWLDTYDETQDGKSVGTVYVQDVGSTVPYSGMGVFEPSYVPSDLRVLPGDVIDFVGPYQEVTNIGSAMFPTGQVLPQLAKPVGNFRYEFETAPAVAVSLDDLNDYAKGRQWEGMLVTVTDVYTAEAQCAPDPSCNSSSDRITFPVLSVAGTVPNANNVAISNELYAASKPVFAAGTHFQSVTGIVTWFFSYHIAPRTPADLVQ